MPDSISNYRQVRLIIDLPHGEETRCHWSLIALSVRKGVPYAQVLERGWTIVLPSKPGVAQIWEALSGVWESMADAPLF